jgi:hypothetical protein
MITISVVKEIELLLAKGKYSHRRIALLLKVSRGTVSAIAKGERPDYESFHQKRREELEEPGGPLQRCPGCGGMVYLPCRLCRMRRTKASAKRRSKFLFSLRLEEPLGLDLKEEHRLRYEEVRAQRMLNEGNNESKSSPRFIAH